MSEIPCLVYSFVPFPETRKGEPSSRSHQKETEMIVKMQRTGCNTQESSQNIQKMCGMLWWNLWKNTGEKNVHGLQK